MVGSVCLFKTNAIEDYRKLTRANNVYRGGEKSSNIKTKKNWNMT